MYGPKYAMCVWWSMRWSVVSVEWCVLLELESGGHDIACSQGEARGLPRSLGGRAGSRKDRRQNGGRGAEKPIDIPAATGKVGVPVRPSHVPRYYVQDWSTGEWMPWRLLQQRLAARRELQGGREQRPRGTRVRGCRAGRRGRSRRSDANCVGVSCEYALSSEEREAECQVIAAMRSVA